MSKFRKAEYVAGVVAVAGGRLVGRTRLQKIAFILHELGYDDEFAFKYKHYGPYSEELASVTPFARFIDGFVETEKPTSWGGTYSIFEAKALEDDGSDRTSVVKKLTEVDAVALELAATALLLSQSEDDPWLETTVRKPEKATEANLAKARDVIAELKSMHHPSADALSVVS